jgi:adenosylmethionine---8-amino-7-oxononanoate aminotransferase
MKIDPGAPPAPGTGPGLVAGVGVDRDDPRWLRAGAAHVWRPYCQHATAPGPLAVVGCRGCRLLLADGRELVDGLASWWTVAHGYRHPHIVEAVQKQLDTLPHVAFGGLAHEAAYGLAERLAALLPRPLTRVFFVESGSVAVEVAVKMAVQSFHNRGQPHRRAVVAFEGAYHGDTFATMALSDPVTGMHRAFAGFGPQVIHLPLPAPLPTAGDGFESAFERVAAQVACVVVEPLVQCAGGFRFFDEDALARMRRACDRHGALLVFDEIATGLYRTGSRWALLRADVVPDIVVIGKALSGGTLPLAAAIATEDVFTAFVDDDAANADKALQHGPTFMGNALACAAAHASLDLFEHGDMSARVGRLEATLRDGLEGLRERPNVTDVRVRGAIGVVEMRPGTAPPSADFARRGAFVRPLRLRHADFVYLMPPLVIEGADVAVLFDALADTLPA